MKMEARNLPKSFKADALEVRVYARQDEMAAAAAAAARDHLASSLARQGEARVILATGNSQIRFLERLVELGGVDWSKITLFHMDEYLGITADHPGSFRRYMRERVEARLKPRRFHYLEGEALEPIKECERYARLVRALPVDLCCLGIGENGHLAFNDPPVADFEDPLTVKLVQLDVVCRQQQVGEGYFPELAAVPQYAFTLTVPALCSARSMICVVPEKRKAGAVKGALRGPINPACPASFLRRQAHCTLFLDADSASLL
jgi:glucosamine-6-phosphate deaminase